MPWAVHDGGDAYWRGTEAGLLGAYDCNADLIATDGSVQSVMGAGAVRFSRGKLLESWNSQVDGGESGLSSHRPEAVALHHGLHMSPLERNVFMLVDNQSTLVTTASWVGQGAQLTPLRIANRDVFLPFLARLGQREGWTTIAKVKSHRAEPANTLADYQADLGTDSSEMKGLNSLPVIVFRASGGMRGAWNKRINRLAHDHAAS
eukprot:3005780-Rhodomonas_salina.1